MGFIFQRRIKLKGGFGFNLSKSGVSPSVRTKYGTIGSKGFSVRTGIPGFYWRSRWGSKDSGVAALILLILWLGYALISFFVRAIVFLVPIVFQVVRWFILTVYDLIRYAFATTPTINSSMNTNNSMKNAGENKTSVLKWDSVNEKYVDENGNVNNERISPVSTFYLEDGTDPLFEEAARIIVQYQQGSGALLQRQMKIGYNRAGKLLDDLEAAGVIGAFDGEHGRTVNILDLESLEKYLREIRAMYPKHNDSVESLERRNIFNFDFQGFLLLEDYANSLCEIAEKLKNDTPFREFIKQSNSDTDVAESDFINGIIIQDVAKIFKLSTDTNGIDLESKEMFGFAFICCKLYKSELIIDYDTLSNVFNNSNKQALQSYYDSCISFLKLAGPEDHVQGKIKDSDGKTIVEFDTPLAGTYVLKVTRNPLFEEYATTLHRFASLIVKIDGVVTKKEEKALKNIWDITHNPIPKYIEEQYMRGKANEIEETSIPKEELNESLDDILNELENLIGLNRVKQEVKTLVNFVKIQKQRESKGLKGSAVSYHCVFTGQPGTGKTTVARIVAKLYKHLEVLTKGHLVETDRSGIIAEYIGQTATKVDKVVKSAIDGVLFIDEAYAIASEGQDDYGREAIATLIKRMEDNRDKLVVILAGYSQEMKIFIEKNPGFKSRFNRYIHFEDYSPAELLEIYEAFCKKSDYQLTNGAKAKLLFHFEELYRNKDKTFGNGRLARNIYEKSIENQANRIAAAPRLTKKLLTTIEADDIHSN